MRNCHICYEPNLTKNNEENQLFAERKFIIPALLPVNNAVQQTWPTLEQDWQLEIAYDFLHRSIIERLIIRLGETYPGCEPWYSGAFCPTEHGQVLLTCDYQDKQQSTQGTLHFQLRGDQLKVLVYVLRKLLKNISPHRRYTEYLTEGQKDKRLLPKFEEKDNMLSALDDYKPNKQTIKLFISYSHKDDAIRKRLETHLQAIKRDAPLEYWHDRDLLAGGLVHQDILKQLQEADIVVLLVSPDFVASDYCFTHEMQIALAQFEQGQNAVIPVIIRETSRWKSYKIGNHTALPTDGKPLKQWRDKDKFWADVQEGIHKRVEDLLKRRGK